MKLWMTINFLDASSPMMEWLILFHDFTILFNLMILVIISYMIILILWNKFNNFYIIDHQSMEFFWTILPTFILMLLSIPSLKILYLSDEMFKPFLHIKTLAHQWFWTYEFPDFKNIEIFSYLKAEIKADSFRLLDTDTRLMLPHETQVQLLVTSDDVIHSFALPTLGIKTDGIPGRINLSNLFISRPGLFFGQCSEICGINHSFMPISVEATQPNTFLEAMEKLSFISLPNNNLLLLLVPTKSSITPIAPPYPEPTPAPPSTPTSIPDVPTVTVPTMTTPTITTTTTPINPPSPTPPPKMRCCTCTVL